MHTRSVWSLPAILVSLALTGCGGGTSRSSAQDENAGGPPVAIVNGRTLSTQDVKAKLEEQPPVVRGRYASLEKKKEFLDNLIRFELLVQEARRQGLEKDPEIQATLEKVMVQKLLRKQQEAAAGTPGDAELRKYYDEHLSEFVRPERVRVSHIFLAAPPGDAGKRAQVRAAAVKLLTEVKSQESGVTRNAFELAAAQQSQDNGSRSAGGDLGFRSREELAQGWGASLAEAAFGLKTASETGQVVETEKGFHLVKLLGRQLGVEQSFDQARARIEARLLAERRAKGMEDFVAGLKAQARIEVKDEALEQLKVEGVEGSPVPPPATATPRTE
jgi:peptidyl-prolyl cis-trans isomerase C